MTNLDHIIKKILDEAKEKQDTIISEAERKAENILAEQDNNNKEYEQNQIARAQQQAENMIQRRINKEEIRIRDDLLFAKQEIFGKIFEKAKEQLGNISPEELQGYLNSALEEHQGEEFEVYMPKKYESRIQVSDRKVHWDDKIHSGFKFVGKTFILNYDFNALLDSNREIIREKIAGILFPSKEL